MALQALSTPRFVRKTQLAPNEYRKNFHQIDADAVSTVTSPEADCVTPLMSKIYLRLVSAPAKFWERQGVLRFETEMREGKPVTAWKQLREYLGVASATARKALAWMHEVGVIGYCAGKNGVGIRIFINRATASIGTRPAQSQKILAFSHASSDDSRASTDETPSNDSFAVLEVSDTDVNSGAPKNGADSEGVDKISSEPDAPPPDDSQTLDEPPRGEADARATQARVVALPVEEVVKRLRSELEPSLHIAARQAAAREHERTRDWLEHRGLPKAARVAQREAYNVLRQYGVIKVGEQRRACVELKVGRTCEPSQAAQALTADALKELAEVCLTMLEIHGQSIDVTLSEMSAEAGGCLLPEDAPKVRALAQRMASGVCRSA